MKKTRRTNNLTMKKFQKVIGQVFKISVLRALQGVLLEDLNSKLSQMKK